MGMRLSMLVLAGLLSMLVLAGATSSATTELVLLSRSCACGVSDGIAAAHLVVAGVGTAAAKAVVIAGVQLRGQASQDLCSLILEDSAA